jgi:hypothetical protein
MTPNPAAARASRICTTRFNSCHRSCWDRDERKFSNPDVFDIGADVLKRCDSSMAAALAQRPHTTRALASTDGDFGLGG